MKQRLISVALPILAWVFQHLSRKNALRVGARFGAWLYKKSRYSREMAINNLRRAYGKKMTEDEIENTARASFINVGKDFAEFCRLPHLPQEMTSIITVEGTEVLNNLVARGKGIILVSAHLGNWELIYATLALKGYDVCVVVQEQKIGALEKLVQEVRKTTGATVFQRGLSIRGVYEALKAGKIVLVIADQHGGKNGVLGRFFDQVVSLPKGPIAFACRTDSVIVPAFMCRNEDDTNTLKIGEAFKLVSTGDKNVDMEYNTRRLAKIIEENIRLAPDQWMWSYDRFTRDISGMTAKLESLVI